MSRKEEQKDELRKGKLIEVITNEWGFTYNDGKFDSTYHCNGFVFT